MPREIAVGRLDDGGRIDAGVRTAVSFSQNLLLWSEDFTNAAWIKGTNVTVTANQATAPDGTVTADLLDLTTAAANVGVYQSALPGGDQAGRVFTRSIWLRSVTGTGTIIITDANQTNTSLTFNLTTTWQRFSVSQLSTSVVTGVSLWLKKVSLNQVYIWGAQVEERNEPGPYAKTTTAAINSTSPARSNADPVIWFADFQAPVPLGAMVTPTGGLSFTRTTSNDTVQTSATTIITGIAANTLRIGDNGSGQGAVIEEIRTNLIASSRNLVTGWSTGTGETMTGNYAAGPDGSVLADREQVSSGNYGRYLVLTPANGNYTGSLWHRSPAGGTTHLWYLNQLAVYQYSGSTLSTPWSKDVLHLNTVTSSVTFMSNDGRLRDVYPAGARDAVIDIVQFELGLFGTEGIITTGSTLSRAGDRLWHPNSAVMLENGRYSFEFKLRPKGGSSDYSSNMYLWWIDASNYSGIVFSTRVLTLTIAGVGRTFLALPTWNADDLLEIWVAGGGGSFGAQSEAPSIAAARVNGGATFQLGTLARLPDATVGPINFLCSAATPATPLNHFSSRLQLIQAYGYGQAPPWAVR